MKFSTLLLLACVLINGLIAASCSNSNNSDSPNRPDTAGKPNIIVIFTDDQGYADLGIQGLQDDIQTPNIDRLGQDGVRMTTGYITAPQCMPSRAGLLSGRYQQRFGLDHNGTIPMPLDEILIPERMQEAGYVTGMVGKWHLEPNHRSVTWLEQEMPDVYEKPPGERVPEDVPFEKRFLYYPIERGFEETFHGSMIRYWATHDLDGNEIEPGWVSDGRFRLDVQSDAAVSFVQRNHDKPFFLYLAYSAPHVPLESPDHYLSRFPGNMPERRRYCLAMMSAIDDGVGGLMKALEEYAIKENTLIFFISDHGAPTWMIKEDKPLEINNQAWDGSLNDPLIGEKGMISEGGIRVPFLISWPAVIPKGIEYDEPVISLDVAATSLAAAGVEHPPELDGVDLIPFLTENGKGVPHEFLYWRFWQQSAIRSGKWKFLKAGEREFLFDLASNGVEDDNLIDQYPERAEELKAKLIQWASELKNPGIPEGPLQGELEFYNFYFPE